MSLKRKLSEQEAELTHLRRLTASEVSSSAEPDNSVFLSPQGPFKRSPVYSSPPTIKHDNTPVIKIVCLQTICTCFLLCAYENGFSSRIF